ncbi:hypothetical protein J2Z35_001184 [Acetoanaerobium pronyense]|uniref:Uncharacterized protein n=1 Tax=Acetoanaerobium pronyense TaxID=1482736 RepID=A0ABS4KJ74_9FIRM|nr:hypothetical protein [Acetoanaerobium pronyense]MBP2027390.1 hypothetical protein [Acetoanaerobium pronyense]
MRYCVVKNTTKVIDGSENSIEIMLQNAQNAGFAETEVEILTEEEYQERLANEPKPPPQPTSEQQLTMEMTMAMAQMQMDNMMAIAELTNLIMAMGGM